MKHILVLLLLTIFITTAGTSTAAEFIPLGDLPGGDFYSVARGISDDGSVIVGTSHSEEMNDEEFIWTAETGIVPLGFYGGWQTGNRISGDGTTVVGGDRGGTEAFINSALEGSSELPFSVVNAVSFDGTVAVGSTGFVCVNNAVRWTLEDGTTNLGTLGANNADCNFSVAYDVSSDGSVIVGMSSTPGNYVNGPFRWTAETGMVGLSYLPAEGVDSGVGGYARAMNTDGSIIVGTTVDNQAFRWTEEEGMVSIEALDNATKYYTYPRGVTDSGNMVVGQYSTQQDRTDAAQTAFLWTAEEGTRKLQQVLADDYELAHSLEGWRLNWAQDISPDGQFIVGRGLNPQGDFEAFVVRLSPPEPFVLSGGGETYLQDFNSIGTGKSMPKGWSGDMGAGLKRSIASLGLVDGPLAGPLDNSPGTAAGLLNLGGSSEYFEGSAGHLATWQRGLVRDGVLNEADIIKDAAEDRALGIGRVDENDPGRLRFEIEIADAPLRAFTLDWDLEVWGGDPDTSFRGTDGGGFAAEMTVGGETYYEATVTHKPGELFYTNWDGADTRYNTTLIDGNIHSVRGNTSGIVEVNATDGAVGNTINLTFDANFGDNDKGWISAVDNVRLRALAPGDADANGVVDVADLLTLLGGQKFNTGVDGVTWAEGDFNADDQFNTGDLLAMLAFLSGQFPSDPYASEAGGAADSVADVIVNSETGEITVDLAGHTTSAILISSAAEIFNGSQPDWDTTSQFPSTLPGELGNVLFTSTASGVDELGVVISTEFLGRDKEFYLQDLDLNILIASEGGALTKGNVIVVPEPSTWAPTMVGLLGLLVVARRRNLL